MAFLGGREIFANFAGVTYIHIIISVAMKSVFQKMSALLTVFAVMFAFTLTSCGDDDPEPAPQPVSNESIELYYSLALDQTWWDFFDIEVTYTTADGEVVTTTPERNWNYVASAKYDEAPSACRFMVTATPKASQPAIDEDAVYDLGGGYNFTAFSIKDNDPQKGVIAIGGTSLHLSAPGSKFPDYAARSHDIVNNSWTIKK